VSAVPCAVSWCAALVTPERVAKGWTHCEVHCKGPHGPKLHPALLAPGEGPYSAVECEECEGSGECYECEGEGEHSCEHSGCYDSHDCHVCRGTGKCQECKGLGDTKGPITAYLKWALNLDAPKPLPAVTWPWDETA
jgi:hypothetical protein